MSERMNEAVAREAEEAGVLEDSEDTGPQSQAELPESQSESGHGEVGEAESSESEMEDGEEDGEDWEDEEDMDSSMESEPEPDPVIFQLVRKGDLAGVRKILSSDRTAVHLRDGRDQTLLHLVVEGLGVPPVAATYIKMARLLLSHGALVNSRANMIFHDLVAPLHIACLRGREKMAELLLTNGARHDLTKDTGRDTPLHTAGEVWKEQVEVVKTLLR